MIPRLDKILFVEDDPDIQFVGEMALAVKGGFQVRICGSGAQALEEAQVFQPDLVLLDVMMPKMNGPTTMKNLKEIPETSRIPVIFMTGKVQPHEVDEYMRLGALDVIFKPFDPLTISQRIRDIWKRIHDSSGRT